MLHSFKHSARLSITLQLTWQQSHATSASSLVGPNPISPRCGAWPRLPQRIGRAQEKLTDDQLYVEGLDQKFGQDFSNLRQRLQHAETELAHVLRQQLKLGAAED